MTEAPLDPITGGVDTHLDNHVVAALDQRGRTLGTESFAASPSGYVELLRWLRSFGPIELVGVEGTGSYGAGLARFLRSEGVSIVEVDRPNRQLRRREGKSDPVDALAAARAAQSGAALGQAKHRDGAVEAIRALRVARRGAVKDRRRAINQLRSLVYTAPDVIREPMRNLNSARLVRSAGALRPGEGTDVVSCTKLALRELARRVLSLEAEIDRLDRRIGPLVASVAPRLLDHHGVGADTAGALLVTAGDNPERLRSEAAFARLCGVAPLPASSGRTQRHRLSRGGVREANSALWRIVLVRMSCHQPTRSYVERRLGQGLSKREVMRCLKRFVARELFPDIRRTLMAEVSVDRPDGLEDVESRQALLT